MNISATLKVVLLATLLALPATAQLPGGSGGNENFKPEDHLLKQAKKDDKKAQLELALCYLIGKYAVEPDADEAMEWLTKAASQDKRSIRKKLPPHPRALLYLGFCYENPMYAEFLELEIDREKALNYYLLAESTGYQEAAQYIAKTYRILGKHKESTTYFKKAADLKIPSCQVEYAKLLLKGEHVAKDPKAALSYLEEAGKKGEAEAFLLLADLYSGTVEGIEQNLDKMVDSLWQAASTRSDAMTRIAYCYLHGIGLPKDELLAYKWYQKAATAAEPDVNGQIGLARCYSQGIGTDKDLIKSFETYLLASSDPNAPPIAHYNVAVCYLEGKGVKSDTNQAFIFLNKAVTNNYAPAQVLLGSLFEQGKAYSTDDQPLPANPQKALELYRKAADQGNVAGIIELGRCYYKGIGTEANKSEGVKLLQRAVKLESEKARMLLEEYNEPIDPETSIPPSSDNKKVAEKKEAPGAKPTEDKPLMQF